MTPFIFFIYFQIPEHKTSASRGPAIITLSPELHKMALTYSLMIRNIPTFTADDDRSLFTCWPKEDGEMVPMNSSQINKAINKIWSKGPTQKTINATKLRKSVTTHVRQEQPWMRESLARHMSHDPRTADKFYNIVDTQQAAITVGKTIMMVMEGKKGEEEIGEEENKGLKRKENEEEKDEHNEVKKRKLEQQEGKKARNVTEKVMDSEANRIKSSIHWPKDDDKAIKDDDQAKKDDDQAMKMKYFSCLNLRTLEKRAETIDTYSSTDTENYSLGENKELVSAAEKKKYVTDWLESQRKDEDNEGVNIEEEEEEEKSKKSEDSDKEKDVKVHGRRFFSQAEAETIIELCEPLLQEGQVKKAKVVEKLQESKKGRELLLDLNKRFPVDVVSKKIVDRVHAERKRRSRQNRSSW